MVYFDTGSTLLGAKLESLGFEEVVLRQPDLDFGFAILDCWSSVCRQSCC